MYRGDAPCSSEDTRGVLSPSDEAGVADRVEVWMARADAHGIAPAPAFLQGQAPDKCIGAFGPHWDGRALDNPIICGDLTVKNLD